MANTQLINWLGLLLFVVGWLLIIAGVIYAAAVDKIDGAFYGLLVSGIVVEFVGVLFVIGGHLSLFRGSSMDEDEYDDLDDDSFTLL